jgi:hypothetical protein
MGALLSELYHPNYFAQSRVQFRMCLKSFSG